ncbi:MAG: hypothetical protein ABI364_04640 [Caldimonas sp.]
MDVLLRAGAHRLVDLLGELHARFREHGRQLPGRGLVEVLELGDEAAVQAAPFARELVQVVALLPALQAVRLGVAFLLAHGLWPPGEDAGKGVEPGRQVVF